MDHYTLQTYIFLGFDLQTNLHWGCSSAISTEELIIVHGRSSNNEMYKYNVKTGSSERLPDPITQVLKLKPVVKMV